MMTPHEQHIASAFDRDLEGIQALIMRMGGLVEEAIDQAARSLQDRDVELAEKIRKNDKAIDALEEQVNEEAARIIALRQPIATDLRTVLTVLKVSGNLERCGDYAKNLAKRTTILAETEQVGSTAKSIRRLADEVRAMLSDALDAFTRRDVNLAEQVIRQDQEVDQMYNALFRVFLTYMMEDPSNITTCMHLHFIAKNIERAGDHVTSIAEQTIYLVTGELPDENRPKADKTSIEESEV